MNHELMIGFGKLKAIYHKDIRFTRYKDLLKESVYAEDPSIYHR